MVMHLSSVYIGSWLCTTDGGPPRDLSLSMPINPDMYALYNWSSRRDNLRGYK